MRYLSAPYHKLTYHLSPTPPDCPLVVSTRLCNIHCNKNTDKHHFHWYMYRYKYSGTRIWINIWKPYYPSTNGGIVATRFIFQTCVNNQHTLAWPVSWLGCAVGGQLMMRGLCSHEIKTMKLFSEELSNTNSCFAVIVWLLFKFFNELFPIFTNII